MFIALPRLLFFPPHKSCSWCNTNALWKVLARLILLPSFLHLATTLQTSADFSTGCWVEEPRWVHVLWLVGREMRGCFVWQGGTPHSPVQCFILMKVSIVPPGLLLYLFKRQVKQLLAACTLWSWMGVKTWESMIWKYDRNASPAAVASHTILEGRGEGNSLVPLTMSSGQDANCTVLEHRCLSPSL